MKVIHINDSYLIWDKATMYMKITIGSVENFNSPRADIQLNRSYKSMYCEWLLHNIGYYLTKPFTKNAWFKSINLRCKDVDLEEWFEKQSRGE